MRNSSIIIEDATWLQGIKRGVRSRAKEITAMAEEIILKQQNNNATEGQVLLPRGFYVIKSTVIQFIQVFTGNVSVRLIEQNR